MAISSSRVLSVSKPSEISRSTWIAVIINMLFGFLACASLMLAAFLTRHDQDLRVALVSTAILFALAGWLRADAEPRSVTLKLVTIAGSGWLALGLIFVFDLAYNSLIYIIPTFIIIPIAVGAGLFARKSVHYAESTRDHAIAFSPLALLVIVLFAAPPSLLKHSFVRQLNQTPSSFRLRGVDGEVKSSVDLKDHVVVLAFWGTWCPPCQGELPKLQAVADHYRKDPHVLVYAVDTEAFGDTTDLAKSYMKNNNLTLSLAFDVDHGAEKSLGVQNLPSMAILDGQSQLRWTHTGYDGAEAFIPTLTEEIDSLVRELTKTQSAARVSSN